MNKEMMNTTHRFFALSDFQKLFGKLQDPLKQIFLLLEGKFLFSLKIQHFKCCFNLIRGKIQKNQRHNHTHNQTHNQRHRHNQTQNKRHRHNHNHNHRNQVCKKIQNCLENYAARTIQFFTFWFLEDKFLTTK